MAAKDLRATSSSSSSNLPIRTSTGGPPPRRSGATPTARRISVQQSGTGEIVSGRAGDEALEAVAADRRRRAGGLARHRGWEARPAQDPGLGPGFVPKVLDEAPRRGRRGEARGSARRRRRLCREEGSSPASPAGRERGAQIARRPENEGKLIVTVIPDMESDTRPRGCSRRQRAESKRARIWAVDTVALAPVVDQLCRDATLKTAFPPGGKVTLPRARR